MAEVSGRNLTINDGPQHPVARRVLLLLLSARAWSGPIRILGCRAPTERRTYLPTALARPPAEPQGPHPSRSQKGAYEGIFKKAPKTYLFDFGAPGQNPGGNCT
jgi:hypothetical protein